MKPIFYRHFNNNNNNNNKYDVVNVVHMLARDVVATLLRDVMLLRDVARICYICYLSFHL